MSFSKDQIRRIPEVTGCQALFRTTSPDDFGLLVLGEDPDKVRDASFALVDAYKANFDTGGVWSAQMEGVKRTQGIDKRGFPDTVHHIILPLTPTVDHFHEALLAFAQDLDVEGADKVKSYVGQQGMTLHVTVKSRLPGVVHRARELALGYFAHLFENVPELPPVTPDVWRIPLSKAGQKGQQLHPVPV
jgi:hypothetical protein